MSDTATELSDIIPSMKDTRNIQDRYKYWSNVEIKDELAGTQSELVIVAQNIEHDFNLGAMIRTGNFLNVKGVWITGSRRWDKRSAVGTFNYTEIQHRETTLEAISELRADGYTVVAAELSDSSVPLHRFEFPAKTAVVFGEESLGLSEEVMAACDAVVEIPNLGSVRSLNVAATASLFIYEYTRQHGHFD